MIKTSFSQRKVVNFDEKNISAQEEARKDGARLQKKNVHKKRQKGACAPPRQGQEEAFLLITAGAERLKRLF